MGTHGGFWFYTIGQRQGIGLHDGPWYVVKKDPEKNIVYISNSYHSEDKIRKSVTVDNILWNNEPYEGELLVKLRHGEQIHKAHLTLLENNNAYITLEERDQGLAPGQFAVFYLNKKIIGSGTIKE